MNKAYLLIGGNRGDMRKNLATATRLIKERVGEIEACSSMYRTAAWGIEDQPSFLNQALIVNTTCNAPQVLNIILSIEQEMGRIRVMKNGPRIIDIDILLFNEDIINTETLKVPHIFLHERNFALIPLCEIAAEVKHPILGRKIRELLMICSDWHDVEIVG